MAARAGNPRETRESPEKSTGGTAANVYKEMQEATKSSDEMTWKGSECILIKRESIKGWMKQLAKLRNASERAVVTTTESQMIARILYNTEEIKKNQTMINRVTKSYSQAAASPPPTAPIHMKPQPIETKRKEVKRKERNNEHEGHT
jgi:hypothetical protein